MSHHPRTGLKNFVALACALMIVVSALAPAGYTQSVGMPGHSSRIVLIALHDTNVYVLDEDGILTISPAKASAGTHTRSLVVYRKNTITSARLNYPFVFFTDEDNILHVYNITKKHDVFSDTAIAVDNAPPAFALHPSGNLLVYTRLHDNASQLIAISTDTWREVYTMNISFTPSFITLSKKGTNAMLYNPRGVIEYKKLQTGAILKSTQAASNLHSLVINNSRRFAFGIADETLIVMDLLNGAAAQTLVLPGTPAALFAADEGKRVISVVKLPDGTQIIERFVFENDGTLENEQAILDATSDVSTLLFAALNGTDDAMVTGSEDGSLTAYSADGTPSADLTAQLFQFGSAMPVRDALISSEALFAVTDTGVIKETIALLPNKGPSIQSITEAHKPETIFIPLPLIKPMLMLPNTPYQNNGNGKTPLLPFVTSRATTTPLVYRLTKTDDTPSASHAQESNSDIPLSLLMQQQNTRPLPYTLSTPAILPFAPEHTLAYTTAHGGYAGIIAYTAHPPRLAQLNHTPAADNESNVFTAHSFAAEQPPNKKTVLSADVYHARTTRGSDGAVRLMLNTPLKTTPTTNINQLYVYNIAPHAQSPTLYKTIPVSVNSADVVFIKHLSFPKNGSVFIARRNDTSDIQLSLVSYDNKKPHMLEIASVPYYKNTMFLFSATATAVKITTIGYQSMWLSTITETVKTPNNETTTTNIAPNGETPQISVSHTSDEAANKLMVTSHTQIAYPPRLARIVRAHMYGQYITAVDTRGIIFTARADKNFIEPLSFLFLSFNTNKANGNATSYAAFTQMFIPFHRVTKNLPIATTPQVDNTTEMAQQHRQ